jgi:hypothetical protein
MEAIFKVGDKVRIKKIEGDNYDYRFGFADEMLEYVGQIFTIKDVCVSSVTSATIADDGHRYRLQEVGFNWASSMLEKVSDSASDYISESIIDFTHKKDKREHYKFNFSL